VSAARCPAHARAAKTLFDQCFAGSLRHAGAYGLADMPRTGELVLDYDGHPITNWTQHLNRLRIAAEVVDWTAHDLRRSMRSHMEGAGVPERHAEECPGHKLGGIKGVYNCWDYLNEKKAAYELWNGIIADITRLPPPARPLVRRVMPPRPKQVG
jgi:integrase